MPNINANNPSSSLYFANCVLRVQTPFKWQNVAKVLKLVILNLSGPFVAELKEKFNQPSSFECIF